ncbi:spermidine/putrescine ABC transporter ATP-binding protein [Bacillus cereus]|nr:spermidine/putrescine ABC transporter ATP-binding protein [Bacillus cereus]PFU28445.1 spermidine/putrescine ABC transporter ATP-binding protein [Bacillus cereus]
MVWCFLFLYPALTGSKTPHQNSAEAKKLGGRTARKSPIGEG